MKTKLFGKMTLFAFVLMVTMSLGFMSPMLSSSLSGATEVTPTGQGRVIELTGYVAEYDLNDAKSYKVSETETIEGFALPKAVVKETTGSTSGETATIEVRNSASKKIDYKTSTDGVNFLNVNESGKYYVTYSVENGGVTTATRDIVINITTDEVSFDFAENSAQIIPTTAVAGDEIVFPMPSIKQGDEVLKEPGEISITLQGADLGTRDLQDKVVDGKTFKSYTIADTDEGTFTLTYSYEHNGNTIYKKFTFNVVKNAPEVQLKYSGYSSSLENLKLVVGEEASLPQPVVVNSKANDAVVTDVYTVVTVKNKNTGETFTVTDFKFTPTKDGDYLITYLTTDLNGKHSCGSQINKNYVKKSGDSITLKVVDDYAVDDVVTMKENFDELENVDYNIPTIVYKVTGSDKTVSFPAVFATGGWGEYKNLKLTRTIYKNNSLQAVLEETKKSGTDEYYKANESASYTFSSAGTYTIRYQAVYVDDEGNALGYDTTKQLPSYTIVVEEVDADVTETDLTVKAPNSMPKSTRKGKTITFNAPTATDYKSGTTTIADKNLKIEVSYAFDGITTTTPLYATKNSDGTYSIEIIEPTDISEGTWSSVTGLTVTFKATNDLGNTATATSRIAIVDYSSDTTAPTLAQVTPASGSETDKIALSTVQFTDANSLTVSAYVTKGSKVLEVYNATTGTDVTLEGIVYTPVEAGDYTVTYVAIDQNNNTTTYCENYTVEFKDGYAVSIDTISSQEYGTTINLLDKIQITKNGANVDMSTITVQMTNEEVTQETLNGLANDTLLIQVIGDYRWPSYDRLDGEIITQEGSIEVRAWAKTDDICDLDKNGSVKISFATSDTQAPTFTIENENLDNTSYAFNSNDTSENVIELPWFKNVDDNNGAGVDYDSMKITLTYQNDSESSPFATFTRTDYEALGAGENLKFTATKQGKINVVYSVKDVNNRESTRTFVLNIGDVTPPEIVVANDAISAPTKVADDGKISIDLSKITVENDDLSSDDITIVVKRDGTTLTTTKENGFVTVDANTAGTYVVTFDIKDAANNSAQTITKTFTVSNDVVSPTNSSTVWGTILIIISLIVLGLVIFFFVKPSKSKGTTISTPKAKDKDNKENK